MRRVVLLVAVLASLVLPASAFAAPPQNDEALLAVPREASSEESRSMDE